MSEYVSNTTVQHIAQRIRAAKKIVLTTHMKPDGDALGAVLALERGLKTIGQCAEIWLMGPLETSLGALAAQTPLQFIENAAPGDDCDLVIVADTGAWSQLGPIEAWLRARYADVIVVDHHVRGDDVGALRLIDPSAASTTQMLVAILEALGCEITPGTDGVAEALFVGLATDTGWFQYKSAGAEVMRLAARLIDLEVDKTRLYQLIEETSRPQRLALKARALASLEYFKDGAVAVMTLRPQDFQETGGTIDDLPNLVNEPMSVGTVRAAILLVQREPKRTKISFRSKPSTNIASQGEPIDVNELAQRFGGGGHFHAAGARLETDIDAARAAVIAALQ